jgi:hypothetical protein
VEFDELLEVSCEQPAAASLSACPLVLWDKRHSQLLRLSSLLSGRGGRASNSPRPLSLLLPAAGAGLVGHRQRVADGSLRSHRHPERSQVGQQTQRIAVALSQDRRVKAGTRGEEALSADNNKALLSHASKAPL